jgi:hypothetical protein
MNWFAEKQPVYAREPDMSLSRAAQLFFRQIPPMLVMVSFTGVLALRFWWGFFSWLDLVPIAVLFVVHPFAEWLIHVFILHAKPMKIGGMTFDMVGAKHHRAHHRDPWDLRYVVMPVRTAMAIGSAIGVVAWFVSPTIEVFLTTMATTAGLAVYYEWIHFLSHTSYRPKGAFYKRQWRLHRLHHFKNENYWFGVTRHFGDMVLGTFPEGKDVPSSPTAKTLGLDDEVE